MAVGYRSVLSAPPGSDALGITRELVGTWLTDKMVKSKDNSALVAAAGLSFDESFQRRLSDALSITNVVVDDGRGGSEQLIRLDESQRKGETWRVNIIASRRELSDRREQTISVEVDPLHLSHDDAVMITGAPGLMESLLERHALWSGQTRVTAAPVPLRGDQGAHTARRAIMDSMRQVSVVIASPVPGTPGEPWVQAIKALTKDARGVSTALVLDESALERLNQLLPPWLQLEPGEVRTFAPHVDPHDETDGLRHRRLSPATFQRHLSTHQRSGDLRVDSRFTRVHAYRARVQFLDQPRSADARALAHLARSAELRLARDAATHVARKPVTLLAPAGRPVPPRVGISTAPPPRTDAPAETPRPARSSVPVPAPARTSTAQPTPQAAPLWMDTLRGFVGELMGDAELSDTSISLLIEHVRESAQQLEAEKQRRAVAEEQLESALLTQDDTEAEVGGLQGEVDILEQLLSQAEKERMQAVAAAEALREDAQERQDWKALARADAASHDDPWEDVPETVLDLVARIDGTPGAITQNVVFTGDADLAAEVDMQSRSSRFATSFWDNVRALDAYAVLRQSGYTGSVDQYLASTESGYKCPPARHVPTESPSVRNRPSWNQERRRPVPTSVDESGFAYMYAHFRTTGTGTFAPRLHYFDDTAKTGKIYIGYIGRHLPNTRTASV